MGRTKGSKNRTKDEIQKDKEIAGQSKDIKKPSNVPVLTSEQKKEIQAQKRKDYLTKKYANMVYEYTPLAETALGATSLYNLYGVVIDAQTPHVGANGKFRQFIKIIDPSMHYKARDEVQTGYKNDRKEQHDLRNGCVSVTFFAKDEESLPQIKKVGDIIRIHRANIGQYKSFKTFCANIDFGSSWALFKNQEDPSDVELMENKSSFANIKKFMQNDLDEEEKQIDVDGLNEDLKEQSVQIKPFKTSKLEYSLNANDYEKVKDIRNWSRQYFANEIVYEGGSMYISLTKVREFIQNENINGAGLYPQEREYCLVVKVEEIEYIKESQTYQGNEKVCLKVTDSSNLLFSVIIPKVLLPKELKAGDVVRITKVAKSREGHEKTLDFTSHTNVMMIEEWFKVYAKFNQKIEQEFQNIADMILGFNKQSASNQDKLGQNFDDLGGDLSLTEFINERELNMSRITEKVFDQYETMSLHQILYTPESMHPKGEFILPNLYKTKFFVVGLQPHNLMEVCQLFCKSCCQCFSFKQFMTVQQVPNCPTCSSCDEGEQSILHNGQFDLEPIFQIQFYVKDKSILNYLNPQKLLLQTCGDVGKEFFNNIQPCNLYMEANQKFKNQIERFLKNLCRYNVVVDAMVEKLPKEEDSPAFEPPSLRIVDCKLYSNQI